MAVCFVRRLQRLFCEDFTLFNAEIATDAARAGAPAMIVKTTCCARKRAQALSHGDAID